MIYRVFLWVVSILLFSAGLTIAIEGAPWSGNGSGDGVTLFVGILFLTIGALVYVHKLRVPPARDPRP